MSEPFLGEIRMFAGNFAPRSWALCDGQLLPIIQNDALFSLLGTQYGGDGRTTFGLPDLRGRVALHRSDTLAQGSQGGSERNGGTPSNVLNTLSVGRNLAVTPNLQAGLAPADSAMPSALGMNYIIALQGIFPSPF